MKITTSLDWNPLRSQLMSQIEQLPYDPAIRKMIKNIDSMNTALSKSEVEARRTKITHYTKAQVEIINKAIEDVQKLIFIAVLYS